jgi:hypothetical protein
MKLCKLNTTSGALLLILSAPFVGQAQTPVIENATVNLAKSYISLAGSNFSPTGVAPTVTVGGTSRTVYSFTDSQIIVEVPSTLATATYLATVTNSVPHSGSAYVTVATAGTVTLPFNGSGAGVTAPVFNITNTAPQYAAISGTGALALSGLNIGGTGVSGNGGPSNGGTTGVPGTGGSGVAAFGGEGTDADDIGGSGVIANGGNSLGVVGGAGITATGGNDTVPGGGTLGGDGIDAYGGTGTLQGGVAVFGEAGHGANFGAAGFFLGDVEATGTISKSGGSFKIDHPLDPANKYLYHSFVESPDMKNIYDGTVVTDRSGTAIVSMPAWFEALNTDFRYQLTTIGQPAQAWIAAKITSGSFTIKTSKPGVEVSWQVTGIRQDAWANAHRIQVEVDKAQPDQGHYIHPELFGHEGEPSIAQMHHPRPPAPAQ